MRQGDKGIRQSDKDIKKVNKGVIKGINMAKKGRGKNKSENPVPFIEGAVYTLNEAARILRRNPDTIRKAVHNKRIEYGVDSAGYLFTGYAIRAYAEGRCLVDVSSLKVSD